MTLTRPDDRNSIPSRGNDFVFACTASNPTSIGAGIFPLLHSRKKGADPPRAKVNKCGALHHLTHASSWRDVDFHRTTRRYILKQWNIHSHRCENLKSNIIKHVQVGILRCHFVGFCTHLHLQRNHVTGCLHKIRPSLTCPNRDSAQLSNDITPEFFQHTTCCRVLKTAFIGTNIQR
jgi:hypothetical protein